MRHERKYRVTHLDWREVVEVVRAHPLSFRTAFPERQVNNIYLDTHDLANFEQNLMGISQRLKYRIRWYGNDLLKVRKPVLEAKSKDAGMGNKGMVKLDDFEWQGGPELRRIVDAQLHAVRTLAYAAAQDAGQQEMPQILPLQGLRPTLINTYQRLYFVSLDGRFRLTIDHDLRFHNPEHRLVPGRNSAFDPAVIVEVKYAPEDDETYDRVGFRMPFQMSRNSKYVTGIRLTAD